MNYLKSSGVGGGEGEGAGGGECAYSIMIFKLHCSKMFKRKVAQ